jgi:peptidoglycan/xylan/chitin deacetylase (PgdA/CDA1 family)
VRILTSAAAAAAVAMAMAMATVAMTAPAAAGGNPPPPPPAPLPQPVEYRAVQTLPDPADSRGPLDILSVSFGQLGDDAFLSLTTRRGFNPRHLNDTNRALCIVLFPFSSRKPAEARVCVAGRIRFQSIAPDGTLGRGRTLDAETRRPSSKQIDVRLPLAEAGLEPGLYRWQALSAWSSKSHCRRTKKRPNGCVDSTPPTRIRFVHVRLAGCGPPPSGTAEPIARGPATGAAKQIALTFDDGPGAATPAILKALEQDAVPATFFAIGDQIAPNAGLLKRMLKDGDMVGNHSWSHPNLQRGGPEADQQLSAASAEIRRVTGFTPCLFRAPYGAYSPKLIDAAHRYGMASVLWNVDPRDWALPGPKAITRRVLRAAEPGSIVLMHDGGGDRTQTVRALPKIIAALRQRGFSFTTVTALTGIASIYVHGNDHRSS